MCPGGEELRPRFRTEMCVFHLVHQEMSEGGAQVQMQALQGERLPEKHAHCVAETYSVETLTCTCGPSVMNICA
jgi:hypothetical protein